MGDKNSTCRMIRLLRFEATYYEEKDQYGIVIVADSFRKLAEGIAKRELAESMDKCGFWLEIGRFVVVTEDSGHNVILDTEHDVASMGYGGNRDYYECYFEGEFPENVVVPDAVIEDVESILRAAMDSRDEWYCTFSYPSLLGDAMYRSPMVKQVIDELKAEAERSDLVEKSAAEQALVQIVNATGGNNNA